MISRLGPSNILFQLGWSILTSSEQSSKSWFHQIKEISDQYSLPDPLNILANPPPKNSLKKSTKLKVLEWWQDKLRLEAAPLDSLSLFRPNFMSLSRPHPIWTSAGSSNYEVKKATVQARMLSGRYRTCWLRRHWSGDPTGSCQVPDCDGQPGTLLHIATAECSGLHSAKVKAVALWGIFLRSNRNLFPIIRDFSLGDPKHFLEFLVDPTTKPTVLSLAQAHPEEPIVSKLCYMTRTLRYTAH